MEWRDLSREQIQQYDRAVTCLRIKASEKGDERMRMNDFSDTYQQALQVMNLEPGIFFALLSSLFSYL